MENCAPDRSPLTDYSDDDDVSNSPLTASPTGSPTGDQTEKSSGSLVSANGTLCIGESAFSKQGKEANSSVGNGGGPNHTETQEANSKFGFSENLTEVGVLEAPSTKDFGSVRADTLDTIPKVAAKRKNSAEGKKAKYMALQGRQEDDIQQTPKNLQRVKVKINDDEVLVYLKVIMEYLDGRGPSDVLQIIRREHWDLPMNDETLHERVLKRGVGVVPAGRLGCSMKNFFKKNVGQEDQPGVIVELFRTKLALDYTDEQKNLFYQLIRMYQQISPGTPLKLSAKATRSDTPGNSRTIITEGETVCMLKGIRQALYFNITVAEMVKVLKGDSWQIPVNAQGQTLLSFIREKYDNSYQRPASSYRSKWRSMTLKKQKLFDQAMDLYYGEKYSELFQEFKTLVEAYTSAEAGPTTSAHSPFL